MTSRYNIREWFFVLMQSLLLILYIFRIPSLDFPVSEGLRTAGFCLSIVGIALVMLGGRALKRNLHPFPSPKNDGTLVTTGIYRILRHPIYIGIILIAGGYGLTSENGLRLLITHILILFFYFKARYEERLLLKKFPEYRDYKAKTFCLFPGVYLG